MEEKFYDYKLTSTEKEQILVYLIENNFINEERFAKSFVRGKHNYKNWGKNRIIQELKFRNISSKLIEIALREINNDEYLIRFNSIAEKHWLQIKERKGQKKNKKFVDYLLRKGFESHLIYDKLKEFDN